MARLLKGPDGKPMTDAEIKHALRVYATNKYGGENKYDFMAIGDTIAQVESGNNPFAHQGNDGPARGKYQYEPPSAESASNRLRDIADIVGYTNPSWNTVENTRDFSKLTETQQDIMFLADKLADGNVDLGSLSRGDTSSKDFWLKNHWKGTEDTGQSAHWDETVEDMKRKQERLERNSRHVEEYNYGGKVKLKKYAKGGKARLLKKYQNGGSVGDPTDPKKPATRQDSLDLINWNAVVKQALIDQGYTPTGERNDQSGFGRVREDRVLAKAEESKLIKQYHERQPLKLAWEEAKDFSSPEAEKLRAIDAKHKIYRDSLKEKYSIDWLPSVNEGEGFSIEERDSGSWTGDVYDPGDTSLFASIPQWDYQGDRVVYPYKYVGYHELQDRKTAKNPKNVQREDLNEYQYLQRESDNKLINEELPKGMYDTRIIPRRTMQWEKDLGNWYGGENIDVVDFPNYDNPHNKPWDLLTEEERKQVDPKRATKEVVREKSRAFDLEHVEPFDMDAYWRRTHPPSKTQVFKTLRKDTNEPTSVQTVKKPKLIKDPVYDTGGDNDIYTMPTFSTGRSKKFTGVQTTDQEGNRIRTSVEDLPEYVRNDKTFQSLIEDANSAYRNASQADGSSKTSSKSSRYIPSKASKALEDIMTGKTTLEEYKSRNIHAEFASGGRVIRVNNKNRGKVKLKKYANGGGVGDPKKKGPKLTYRDPENTYLPSDNMSMEDIERIMSLQGGFPLGEAVVEDQGGPRIYSREGMSQFAKQGSEYGLEAARFLPFVGEALDAGDIYSAGKTGKDLSGYDATPEGRAAMLGAGLIIPNLIERPVKAAFKFLKKLKKPVSRAPLSQTVFPASEIAKAPVNERGIMKRVQNSDLVEQAKIDISLHDQAQGSSYWNKEAKQFLEEDKKLKQRFIDLIEGKNQTKKEINEVIEGLKSDQNTHRYYLDLPTRHSEQGSNIWHNQWISVYDGWIDKLQNLGNGGKVRLLKK